MAGQVHGLMQQTNDFDPLVIEAEHDDVGGRAHEVVGTKLSRGDSQGIETKIIDLGGVGGWPVGLLVDSFDREGDQATIASGGMAAVEGGALGERGVDVPPGARGDDQPAHVRRVGGLGCPATP